MRPSTVTAVICAILKDTDPVQPNEATFVEQLRYLGKYLRPHSKMLILSLSLSIFSTALGMIQPYFAKILIDRVFMEKLGELLPPLLGIMIGLLLISFIVRVGNNYLYTLYSSRILFKMRQDLFDHLQRIPLGKITQHKIGNVYSRIASDMADIQSFLTDVIPHLLFNFLTCVITVIILLWLNWKMALLSFILLPAGLVIIYRLRPKIYDLSKNVAESNADIAQFLFESLSNMHLIRAFGAEKLESGKLKQKQGRILTFLLRYQVLGAVSGSVPTLFVIFNTLVVFGYGGWLVLDSSLTIGSLVAFSIYQGRVFTPLQGLLDGFLTLQKSKVAFIRSRELLDIDPGPEPSEGSIELHGNGMRGHIVFDNVSFAYEPKRPVFERISFEVLPGKTTALVGPSGAGKSTICHLILRLFDPDTGRIIIDRNDLKRLKTASLRRHISLVSQDIFLFHTSIAENISFGNPSASRAKVVSAARAACIDEFIRTLPHGYDSVVGHRGVTLSGGQKQRICIARSFLLDPRILILDEATAFLDASVEEQLKATMQDFLKNRTIIIVSHRPSAIRHADRVIAMDNGSLIYNGPAAEDKCSHDS